MLIGNRQLMLVLVCYEKGLSSNGTSSLQQQLGGLSALGVQQLLAATTQNPLASTQGTLHPPLPLHRSRLASSRLPPASL